MASWEIEALTDMLLRAQGDDFSPEDRAARTILLRLRELGQCVMASVGDERDEPEETLQRIFPDAGGADFESLGEGA